MSASMLFGRCLEGRTVFVTGASSGLGVDFARAAARAGARVAIGARRVDRLHELAAELRNTHGCAVSVHAVDVTEADAVDRALVAARDALGPLDVVVNNAGLATTEAALAQADETANAIFDVNLRGVWNVATRAARHWASEKRPGVIVNIASILGIRVAGGVAAYSATKAAVIQLTKSFALEWARHDIRVNALAPGYVETELNRDFFASEPGKKLIARIPMRRLGNAGDLDGPFLLLASDASRYMTGSVLVVDGGHLVSTL
jgi:NAD(P)-dependent dehydrogenase (short-subunit alcohol dehydrogenase family)